MSEAPFLLVEPQGPESPVVVEVPHAGLHVPPAVLGSLVAPAASLARDADLYVDDLFADAPLEGATLLAARTSRYVVDLNRAEDDLDAEAAEGAPASGRAPRGVIWRLTGDGARVLARPLTRQQLRSRIDTYHRPYHAALQLVLARKVERFGLAVLLAAHSMPSQGRTFSGEAGPARADVVPGTRGRTSAEARFIDAVDAHARAHGWSVRHDDPYRGGYTTAHYGRPSQRVHAVQIELARRLYMNEDALLPHTQFQDVRQWCRALVAKLAQPALR
jgi:N-formylglutamate amidohydrolase